MNRVDFVKNNLNGSVLDLGFNSGKFHELIDDGKLLGLDIIVDNPNERTVLGSVLDMPFPEKSFDTLIAGELIEHFSEKEAERFLVECKRVLREKGVLIISTPNKGAWSNRLFHQFDNAGPLNYSVHKKVYKIKELIDLVSQYFEVDCCFLLPYDEVSSPNQVKTVYFFRKLVNVFLPNSLKEEIILKAIKK